MGLTRVGLVVCVSVCPCAAMPIKKYPRQTEPLWKEKDYKALKKGLRHTVYSVNGDSYKGEWLDNMKNGPGTYTWKESGAVYDGEWKHDLRNGFGMYSKPTSSSSEEEGPATFKKVYAGGWLNDKKHGHGTYYYTPNQYYEGEWSEGMRSGWGRMFYQDGSTYEGEWANDERNGWGMLRLRNDNRYEGKWKDDAKHGQGKFYYLNTGQVLTGTWVDNVSKCGTMEDFNRESATAEATQYPIHHLKLQDYEIVLADARKRFEKEGAKDA